MPVIWNHNPERMVGKINQTDLTDTNKTWKCVLLFTDVNVKSEHLAEKRT